MSAFGFHHTQVFGMPTLETDLLAGLPDCFYNKYIYEFLNEKAF